jgi:hypothetical protein
MERDTLGDKFLFIGALLLCWGCLLLIGGMQ